MTGDVRTTTRRWFGLRPAVLTAIVTVGILVLLQLVPYRITNPSARADVPWDSARTEALFARACADCHSNHARSEWYEHVAPISWWIKGHIDEGRGAFNIDEYPNMGEDAGDAAETIRDGGMPPSYYTWFGRHPDANLTQAEQDELVKGLKATFGG